jgi:hypothetical protein
MSGNMGRIEGVLRALASPIWLPVYLASLTLVLGWSAHREALRYFGINPNGLDNASADTYVNYFGYGLRAFCQPEVGLSVFAALILVWGWLQLPELIRWRYPNATEQRHVAFFNIWIIASLGLLVVVLPFTFLAAEVVGRRSGMERAETEYQKQQDVYWPISWLKIADGYLLPQAGEGCWRQVIQDKRNVYVFWSPIKEVLRPRRRVFIVPIDKFQGLYLQEHGVCQPPP